VPEVLAEDDGTAIAVLLNGMRARVPSRVVRLNCQSAKMVDEFTGAKLFKEEDIATDVRVKTIATAGRYAVSIDWSDGHSSLFSYSLLDKVCAAHANTG